MVVDRHQGTHGEGESLKEGLWPRRRTLAAVLCGASLFPLNVALNAVLFLPGESPYRDSI